MEENIKEIKKTVKRIGKKSNGGEFELMASVKEAVYDSIKETGTIDNERIVEQVFKKNVSAKLTYQEEVNELKFVDKTSSVREPYEISEKKFDKQKLKMDNGIESIVPLDAYRNGNLIESVNNLDDTMSIMLKSTEKTSNQL